MTAAGIISAMVIGAIIGALGRLVLRDRQSISFVLTIVVGIVAAVVGTWIASLIDVKGTAGIDWIELLIQIALAAVGVALVTRTTGRRR